MTSFHFINSEFIYILKTACKTFLYIRIITIYINYLFILPRFSTVSRIVIKHILCYDLKMFVMYFFFQISSQHIFNHTMILHKRNVYTIELKPVPLKRYKTLSVKYNLKWKYNFFLNVVYQKMTTKLKSLSFIKKKHKQK